MPRADQDREARIADEIVVDCYNEDEKATGWYCHLESAQAFPFRAACVVKRRGTPLGRGQEVSILGMADQDYCSKEMFVYLEWQDMRLAVPLIQLKPLHTDGKTLEAAEHWHYWVGMGYQF